MAACRSLKHATLATSNCVSGYCRSQVSVLTYQIMYARTCAIALACIDRVLLRLRSQNLYNSLHYACMRGDVPLAHWLVKHGCPIDAVNEVRLLKFFLSDNLNS